MSTILIPLTETEAGEGNMKLPVRSEELVPRRAENGTKNTMMINKGSE
jgi:hypothetical protein